MLTGVNSAARAAPQIRSLSLFALLGNPSFAFLARSQVTLSLFLPLFLPAVNSVPWLTGPAGTTDLSHPVLTAFTTSGERPLY